MILLFKCLFFAKRSGINELHLLYLDNIFIPLVLLLPLLLRMKITATLHWYPNHRIKIVILSMLFNMKILDKLVVHGVYTKNKIAEAIPKHQSKIVSINYPNLHPVDLENNTTLDFAKYRKPILLAFGGLRYDKGIDILLKSLCLMKQHLFTLVIAGAEDYFKRENIENIIAENGLADHIHLVCTFIPDSEVSAYFNNSDIVVLPYRKIFKGQSGPLTEGVMRSKIIIGPESGEIGFTIRHYGIGLTFQPENVSDLANKLEYTMKNRELIQNNISSNQENYKNTINVTNFKKRYCDFFEVKI
jgi:glycosyltransferase involved in cell wall biosynthesis